MRKQDINYKDKLGQLRFDVPFSKGKIFILVEGESDVKLFRKLFNRHNCKIEWIPGGNHRVEQCVAELLMHYHLVIGIRDADFLHLEDVPYADKNMFLTDFHDIEMMIFSEDELFSALIGEHTNLSKDKHLEERDNILNSIKQIGLLKWLNVKENLKYNFGTGFFELLSFKKPIDFELYFSRLLAKSPTAQITEIAKILHKIALLEQSKPDLFQLCNGHDFLSALAIYLREVHGANNVNNKNIESSCRIAYTIHHFQKSALYQNTKRWADNNDCLIH